MRFPRDFAALCLRVLAAWIDRRAEVETDFSRASPEVAVDFAIPGTTRTVENVADFAAQPAAPIPPRCFNVWHIDHAGRWALDAKGSTHEPGRALARAIVWDVLGVGACVLPSGFDPNSPATLPPGWVGPWQQVARVFVSKGVVS